MGHNDADVDQGLRGAATRSWQALIVCLLLVNIRGNSYRMRDHRDLLRPAADDVRDGGAA